jgi:hypothetical protein
MFHSFRWISVALVVGLLPTVSARAGLIGDTISCTTSGGCTPAQASVSAGPEFVILAALRHSRPAECDAKR